MCLVVPYSKIVKYFLVSCIYPAIDGKKASSSRSVEEERQIERGKRPTLLERNHSERKIRCTKNGS
jgi:hypothetical protein